MRNIYKFAFGLMTLSLLSCASYQLKNQCEATNWFEYGQQIAKEGRYLEEDGFVKQCKEVERISATQIDLGFKLGRDKLCSYEQIEKKGAGGEVVYFDFCNGLDKRKMKEVYSQGLKEFCTPESGLTYGRSGEIYKDVCPKETEPAFLEKYSAGRKIYLEGQVHLIEGSLAQKSKALNSLERSESMLSSQYSGLPNFQTCSQVKVFDASLKRDVDRRVCEEASYIKIQRENLLKQLDRVRADLGQSRSEIRQLEAKKTEFQTELIKLP